MKNYKYMTIFLVSIFILSNSAETVAQVPSDYLILQSIGDYRTSGKGKCFKGGGIVGGAGHFEEDHDDLTCTTGYYNITQDLAVSIQVTKHTDSPDSIKWLLHEVDRDFRNYFGIPGMSYGPRQIDGQTVLEAATAGREYRWLSGDKVIMIEYHDSQMTKPEPIEVVKAYLAKHPSTLQPMRLVELRSPENKTKWIKDEMNRRLWLCDKWFYQLQLGKVQQVHIFQEAVKSMNVFLDYREKYYGIKAADEKNLLASYLNTNNGTGIKAKLKEYKDWWALNKDKPISIQ